MGRTIDKTIGGLPLPPKAMQVLRGEELRKLGEEPAAGSRGTSGDIGEAAGCPPLDDNGPYARRLRGLLGELRLFAVCNLALFVVTAVLMARRRSQAVHGLVPASLLAATTLTSSIIYFAGRDWFWAFLESGFAGKTYLLVVSLVAALLADIAWNRARVVRVLLRLLWWVPV
jgi:hypothetical protein